MINCPLCQNKLTPRYPLSTHFICDNNFCINEYLSLNRKNIVTSAFYISSIEDKQPYSIFIKDISIYGNEEDGTRIYCNEDKILLDSLDYIPLEDDAIKQFGKYLKLQIFI